jgi:steroid delta-isomerase-like uncharacterized protein
MMLRRSFLVAGLAALPTAALAQTTPTRTAAPDLRARVDDLLRVYATLDMEALSRFMTDDIHLVDPTFKIDVKGKAELVKMFKDARNSYQSFRVELENVIISGNRVATQQTASGKFRGPKMRDWKDFAIKGCTFYEFRGTLIARWTDYYDSTAFREQVRGNPHG